MRGERMGRGFVRGIAVVACASAELAACPLCGSDTAVEVRAGLFDGRFVENLLLLMLPLGVMGMIVAVVHFDLFGRGMRWACERKGSRASGGYLGREELS